MLYLIRSFVRGGSILKIGYASSLNSRIKNYESTNPGIELVSAREGTRDDESLLHVYLHFLGYKVMRSEWYSDCYEVISKFHSNISSIKSFLWKHRGDIFPQFWEKRRTMGKWKRIYELISEDRKNTKITGVDILYHRICKSPKPTRRSANRIKVDQFLEKFDNLSSFPEKMKLACEFLDSSSKHDKNLALSFIPNKIKNFYLILGSEIIRKFKFLYYNCSKEFWDLIIYHKIEEEIKHSFVVGDMISRKDIKFMLKTIYDKYSYSRSPKASDLNKYFYIAIYYDKGEEKLLIKGVKAKSL